MIDQTIALLEQGSPPASHHPELTLRDVPGQVKGQIVPDALKSPMLDAFKTWPPSISETDRNSLTMRAIDAHQQVVLPAFRKLGQFLETRYLPACRTTTERRRAAEWRCDDSYNIKWHTTDRHVGPGDTRPWCGRGRPYSWARWTRSFSASGFKGGFATRKVPPDEPQFYFTDSVRL